MTRPKRAEPGGGKWTLPYPGPTPIRQCLSPFAPLLARTRSSPRFLSDNQELLCKYRLKRRRRRWGPTGRSTTPAPSRPGSGGRSSRQSVRHGFVATQVRPGKVAWFFGRPFPATLAASLRAVIAAAEVLFQPAIEGDEKVPAAHLLDFEFRFADAPVTPGDWNHRPGVSPHDRLQW